MLRSVNVKYTLAYPASLRFTWQGKNRVFTSSADAEQFIKEHCGAPEKRDQMFVATKIAGVEFMGQVHWVGGGVEYLCCLGTVLTAKDKAE